MDSSGKYILGLLIAERGRGPDYTFNAEDSSFAVNDNFGSEMQGHFNGEGDGAYSMTVLVDGMERTIYAEDFSDYASDWDDLVLDPEHEYLDSLIQDMIRKEEKSSW